MSEDGPNGRRDLRAQQRELEGDRRRERMLLLFGVTSLIPVAAIIVLRQLFFG